jgi:hypothetical protein
MKLEHQQVKQEENPARMLFPVPKVMLWIVSTVSQ